MGTRGRPRSFDRGEALQKAMEVFWDRGYDGASMADLTRAMGINSPSLYAAFGSKAALFREALDLYAATEGAGGRCALDEGTAREALRGMLRATVEGLTAAGKPRGCMIVLGACQGGADGDGAALDALLRARRARAVEDVRRRLRRGVDEGDLPPGADVEALTAFYATVLQGLSLRARDGASRAELLGIVESAMAAWDALLRPAAPRRGAARGRRTHAAR
ncbi:transcriptional regulator, TetR family [Anaeromyxobacter dehalogenans 2CP-1]|uniref:Transcriptional regulator, TetR family n=1 Tax=Anaeromyxobacter dehalogenans (strain ATCC BAA-258 / DSM 21875 / 2CP-1) TaxID=455488 RepID=B8JHF2_ANAD2|nr:TetR/AcrR family transcriptional regulator [Anaeromyxobacter dehalogenans]ACL66664.1 transcriptional regulator, TetR family [Anaeromyxobacter dehalogenans 2CP-1]